MEIQETIKVYLRQRPSIANETPCSSSGGIGKILNTEDGIYINIKIKILSNLHLIIVWFSILGSSCTYISSINKAVYEYRMNYIFEGGNETQTDVYTTVAKPIVDSAIQGYSGTIIAYGPTNSGKTFTMRGGQEDQMGIMPRYVQITPCLLE